MTTALARPPTSSAEETLLIVQEAYIYLYPLLLMDVTRKQMINSDPKVSIAGGPANAFTHFRTFPPLDLRVAPRPNYDTLYSSAWLDLTRGPMIVSTEDTGGRYFLLPMLDMWGDVFATPGKRTTGTGAATFAVIPPHWNGPLPKNVEPIDAPTPHVFIVGRTQTNGVEDYETVHKIQDGYRITYLDDWGRTPRKIEQLIDPSVDTKTEPMKQVAAMTAAEYFTYGAELMKINPPHLTDWSINVRMKRIGIEPGRTLDADKANADLLAQGAAAGLRLMQDRAATLFRYVNGWLIGTAGMGVFGNDYLKRAVAAMVLGIEGNQPEDSIYPFISTDADGQPVMGEHRYVMHFSAGETPPVSGFWSLSMYDAENFPVANPIDRYAIGDRNALEFNADGSLDLYVQHENPGPDKVSNWLPAPARGTLNLTMRLYAPKPQALDGRWVPPPVRRVP
jgi:hypothetical protein